MTASKIDDASRTLHKYRALPNDFSDPDNHGLAVYVVVERMPETSRNAFKNVVCILWARYIDAQEHSGTFTRMVLENVSDKVGDVPRKLLPNILVLNIDFNAIHPESALNFERLARPNALKTLGNLAP
jgi:hypothetical protein